MKNGLIALGEMAYHADPCPLPSLSASIIKVMLDKSMEHAREEHPRLRKFDPPERESKYDHGTAVHAYVLEGGKGVAVIDPADYPAKNGNVPTGWTNDAIRAARDEAISNGLTPILKPEWDKIAVVGDSVKAAMLANSDIAGLLNTPHTEQSIVWQEDNGVWCRARIDIASADWSIIGDLKTSKLDLTPDKVCRQYAPAMNWPIQAAFYLRGIKKLGLHESPEFRFILAEIDPPFTCSVYAISEQDLVMANEVIEWAINQWRFSLDSDKWPGYSSETMLLNMPAWYAGKLMMKGE